MNGPTMMARIGVMRALKNRNVDRIFDAPNIESLMRPPRHPLGQAKTEQINENPRGSASQQVLNPDAQLSDEP